MDMRSNEISSIASLSTSSRSDTTLPTFSIITEYVVCEAHTLGEKMLGRTYLAEKNAGSFSPKMLGATVSAAKLVTHFKRPTDR